MGYNTTLMVLNDSWHEIKKDPRSFVELIDERMLDPKGRHARVYPVRGTQVMRTDHADVPRLYFTYANRIIELGAWSDTPDEYRHGKDFQRDIIRGNIETARDMLDSLEAKLDAIDGES